MTNGLTNFVNHFNEVADYCSSFCCLARGKEFQIESVEKLEALVNKAGRLKKEAIALREEDAANLLLSLQNTASAIASELLMWISLKEDDPNTAWAHLVSSQGKLASAIRSHHSAAHLESNTERLRLMERILFPPQQFTSVGYVIQESRCSICLLEYSDCEHIKGRAYMGRMCAREIVKADLAEVSLVSEPANRDCRILNFTENGITRDVMTWRVRSETDLPNGKELA